MENAILIYLLKVSISIAVFYLLFKMLFGKDTFYQLKRIYFLFSIMFSILFPFYTIEFTPVELEQLPGFVYNIGSVVSEVPSTTEIIAGSTEPQSETISLSYILLAILLVGTIGFFARFLAQLLSLASLLKNNNVKKHEGYRYVDIKNTSTQAFSFFQWIFIPADTRCDTDIEAIIQHEITHARQVHSADVVLFELMCVLFWWNPFMWLMRREVRVNLEYLADRGVLVNGYDAKKYQYALLNEILQDNNLKLVNNFNFSELKNRITMMNRKKTSTFVSAKYLLIAPFASVLLLGNALSASTNPSGLLTEIVPIKQSEVVPFVEKKDTTKKVYDVVDKMPSYPGGEEARLAFLKDNIIYPAEAHSKEIEGQVIVGFIVSEVGKLENIRVVRGANKLLDDEAIRITKLMPKWIPATHKGEKVSVDFIMRITFKLTKKEVEEEQKTTNESDENKSLASFPGGEAARINFLRNNIIYPSMARENGIQGVVDVSFIVQRDGRLTNLKIKEGVDKLLDDEALRVMSLMPKWAPATENGKNIASDFSMKISFKLN